MSIRLMAAVFELDIPASEKLVLLALADHADDVGENCFPSIRRIARMSSMSRRGVQKVIRRIESKGIICSIGRRPNGTVKYRITVAAIEGGEHGSPGERTTFAGEGRTLFVGAANLSAQGDEPGSPESSLTTNEPPRRKKNLAAKPAPPADPRFRPFFTFVYEAYRSKHGQAPNWTGKDRKLLRQFLAEHPHITAQEFQRRFGHYLNSTEDFTRKQGASLAYFVAHFDVFLIGPLSDRLKSGQQARDRCTDSPAIRAEPGKYDSVEVHRVTNNAKLHAV